MRVAEAFQITNRSEFGSLTIDATALYALAAPDVPSAKQHAKDVVPEIVAMTGRSIRTAQENSVTQRREMIAKRDRHIWAMHCEGRTQEAIGAALEVPRTTVETSDCSI